MKYQVNTVRDIRRQLDLAYRSDTGALIGKFRYLRATEYHMAVWRMALDRRAELGI